MKVIPCPHCGAHKETIEKEGGIVPALHVTHDEERKLRYVECEACGSRGPVATTWEEAWNHWNHRKP